MIINCRTAHLLIEIVTVLNLKPPRYITQSAALVNKAHVAGITDSFEGLLNNEFFFHKHLIGPKPRSRPPVTSAMYPQHFPFSVITTDDRQMELEFTFANKLQTTYTVTCLYSLGFPCSVFSAFYVSHFQRPRRHCEIKARPDETS